MAKKQSTTQPADVNGGLMLGTHVSVSGGFSKGLERAESIGCTAMQVFVKGNTRWDWPAPKPDDVKLYCENIRKSPVRSVIAHTIYLVNLCSDKPAFVEKSIADMIDEINRCELLGIEGLVMHPGAHCGAGMEAGLAQVRTRRCRGVGDRP